MSQLKSFYGIPLIPLPPDVSRILFVSNLDTSMTGDMLYKIFGSIGPVRQIRVSDSAETANTAFVIYEDVFHAKTAQEKFNGFVVPSKAKKGANSNNTAANRPLQVRFFNQKSHLAAAEKKKKRQQQIEELGRRQRELAEKSAIVNNSSASSGGAFPTDAAQQQDDESAMPAPPNDAGGAYEAI